MSVFRRRLLAGFAAAAVVSALPLRIRPSAGEEALATLRAALHEACAGAALPGSLGRACLQAGLQVPVRGIHELAASLERSLAAGAGFGDWFRTESVADFEAGRVVQVDGWVISETEFLLFSRFAA